MADSRPDSDAYLMGIAMAVRRRANCKGSRVGAVIARGGAIVSTGYNGTPAGMPNCLDGGCLRCANREEFAPGAGYDLCICVHAEQNALIAAARFGIAVEGATLYTTTRPCFGCTKEALQARIRRVCYLHDWKHPEPRILAEYNRIQERFEDGVQRLDIEDPDRDWAVSKRPPVPATDATGHSP